MPRIRVLISGVLAMVALSGCLLHPSDAESNQHTGVDHSAEPQRQVARLSAQQDQYDRQAEIAEAQLKRMDALLTRWEKQADRRDALLDREEREARER